MDQPSIILRPAEPTLDDGLAFARYLDEAAEGFFGFMLGRRSADIIAKAFAQAAHDLSYEHVTFAERDNAISGMISGYTAQQHRGSTREPLKQAAAPHTLRMRMVLTVLAPLVRIIDSIDDEDFYLQAIAVDEAMRGGGVGSLLLDALEQQARAAGSARLALDVSAKNDTARRFYERRGMTIESQWPKRLPLPGLRFYRMVKPL